MKPSLADTNTLLRRAFEQHQKQQFAAAKDLYSIVLKRDKNNFDALQLLGLCCYQAGETENALKLLNRALSIRQDVASVFNHRGIVLRALGRNSEALPDFEKAVKLDPRLADAYYNRGNALRDLGRLEEARLNMERAFQLKPNRLEILNNLAGVQKELGRFSESLQSYDRLLSQFPNAAEAHSNRGLVLHQLERFGDALESFDRAVLLRPDYAEAFMHRGLALHAMKQFEAAVSSYNKAINLRPDLAQAHNNRGNALKELNRFDEALQDYDKAVALNPGFMEAYNNKGVLLSEMRRLEEALQNYEKAIAVNPASAETFSNMGNTLIEMGRLYEARTSFERAKSLKADYAGALWSEANLLLLMGDLDRGLRQYEFRETRLDGLTRRRFRAPQFSASDDLKGKRLLIWPELYLGDMIQFCRYGLIAEQMGASVSIAAPEKLKDLLSTLSPSIAIVPANVSDEGFDYHLPLMSTPLAFHDRTGSISAPVPYLKADAERMEKWGKVIGPDGIRIGLCWQGSKLSEKSGRSFSLSQFHTLSERRGVRLISLQKHDGVEQLVDLPGNMKIEQLGNDFDVGSQAFLDTAAVMQHLDLIITCDTSIAHLAGALGRPTWLLLKQIPDWRWFLDTDKSLWYPSLRLFRQKTRDDWTSVFEEVVEAFDNTFGDRMMGESRT